MAKPIIRRNATFARLSFFTQEGKAPGNRIDAYDEWALPSLNVETSLVGFEFNKNLGEAAGSINITLKGFKRRGNPLHAGKAWTQLIKEGDWWGIDIIKNGKAQGLSFGKIDTVGVDIAGSGEGAVVVTVSGRGFGYALNDTPLFFNPHVAELDNVVGTQMMQVVNTAFGSASEVIVNVINGFMGGLAPQSGHHKIPAGMVAGERFLDGRVKWINGLDTNSCVFGNLRGKLLTQPMFTPTPQALWDYLQAWRNPVLNEMFIDVKATPGYPKQACLKVREKPFVNVTDGDNSPWFRLTTHEIDATMIRSINVSQGANRINYVSLSGDQLVGLNEEALTTTFLTVTDAESVKTHGLKRLEEYTRYYDEVKNAGGQVEGRDWLNMIVSWNVLNHEYWQGQIVLGELEVPIRVGEKIAIINGPPAHYSGFPTDKGVAADALTFYVEGISHRYTTGATPEAVTTLRVSRGFTESQRTARVAVAANPDVWDNLLKSGAGSANDDVSALNTTTAQEDALIRSENGPLEYRGESNATV